MAAVGLSSRLARSVGRQPPLCVAALASPANFAASTSINSSFSVKSSSQRWGPLCQDSRGVARVRINRFTGVKAVKLGAPKTEWQIAAEKEFLKRRSEVPKDGYVWDLTAADVENLSPEMQAALSLKCANSDQISRYRKQQLIRQFQRRPFDTNSPAVRIATMTEKILKLRAHLLRHPKNKDGKFTMAIRLTKRMQAMKTLYKTDYVLYKHVCEKLGIRCIRFAIPGSRDPQKFVNPQATDGDRARFQIRQRMYHAQFRPRQLREPGGGRLIRYTRHPLEPVPANHGQAKKTPQQISRAWPYGVRSESVEGKQVVYNPTAAGTGFWPARGRTVGGPTPETNSNRSNASTLS